MDEVLERVLAEDTIEKPITEDKIDEEEEILEPTTEVDQSLELPQEKRRVYSDKNDRSIYELERRQRRGDLNLDPEFQRNYVWDDKKASLLVESVLLEIPIPVIYLAEESDGKFTIIDGQQRLRSFFRFYNNVFKLRGLKDLAENRRLQENKDFLLLLGLDEPQKRMQQREIVLHFLAFYHQTYTKYRPPMRQFLNKEMEENKIITEEKLNTAQQTFKDAISLAKTVFGNNAFRRFTLGNEENPDGKWEKRVNMGLFEIIMYGFSRYRKSQIIQYSDIIRDEFISLSTSSPNFLNCIGGTGTTNTDKVNQRFKIWEETLEKVIGMPKTEPRLFDHELKKTLYDQSQICGLCGNRIMLFEDATVDHIEPYCSGGETIKSNARLAHRYCNSKRGGNKAVM